GGLEDGGAAIEAVLNGVTGVEDQDAAERLDGAVVLQRQAGDRAEPGDQVAVVVEDVGGGDGGDQAGGGGELDGAVGAGELQGSDVELERAAGVDHDAVGGVEVADDDGGGAQPLEIHGAAVGVDLTGGLVVDVVVDLQGAAGGGLEDGGAAVEAVLNGVTGVEDQDAAERLDGAVVLQRQAGDRAEPGAQVAGAVADVGGGAGRAQAGGGGELAGAVGAG